jgi:hypothetical protein
MNNHGKSLQRLLEAARRAPAQGDEPAPFGFATRVAARAFEPAQPALPSFARLFAVVAVGVNYRAITSAIDDESAVASGADDPIADVVNLDS